MQSKRLEPFSDNWAYLKAELSWLDRVLTLAIARQQRETQAVERVARTQADRVTSHWWKGIIFLEEEAGYDDCKKPPTGEGIVKVGYQQQMHSRIQATRQQGISLGLPYLCDRLKLSSFEKNIVLLTLAPELNRRYARLYKYLQSENGSDQREARTLPSANRGQSDLPTVDLALRILCRNDGEWRAARTALTSTSGLVRHRLLKLTTCQEDTLLARRLQLSDSLVNFLLADNPDSKLLDKLFVANTPKHSLLTYLHQEGKTPSWNDLILPPALLAELQHLSHQVQLCDQVDQAWGFQSTTSGVIAFLVGPAGTGKTAAAGAIAQSLSTPLAWLDLSLVDPNEYTLVLQGLAERSPQVLLLKSAQVWFGRTATIPQSALQQFLQRRQQQKGVTLLSCRLAPSLPSVWRPFCQSTLTFPLPDPTARLQFWQQAFPASVPLAADIDWKKLAQERKLSGGTIRIIARDAAFAAATTTKQVVEMAHILQALNRVLKSSTRIL